MGGGAQLSASEVPLWTDSFDAFGHLQSRARVNGNTTYWGYAGASNDVNAVTQTFLSGRQDVYSYAFNRAHQVIAHGISSNVPLAHPAAPGTVDLGGVLQTNQLSGLPNDAADLRGDGVRSYTYDTEGLGRIVTATSDAMSASYRYDPFGRRYSKTVNGVTTVYLHDDEGRAFAEFDGTSGPLLRYWLYNPNAAAPVVSLGADGYTGLAYPGLDRLGSVVSTSDGYGAYLDATGYLPYGESATGAPPPGSGFGYAGYRHDPETGLYYVRNRYYDPRLGRFLTPDPSDKTGGGEPLRLRGERPAELHRPKRAVLGRAMRRRPVWAAWRSGAGHWRQRRPHT